MNKKYFSRSVRVSSFLLSVASTVVASSGEVLAQPTLPIVVSVTENLHFGTFFTVGSSGTLTVNTTGGRSVTGGVTAFAGAGLEQNGVISISASTGVLMTVEFLPTSATIMNGTGQTMVVDDFNINTNAGGDSIVTTLTQSTVSIPFGARLNVTSPQAQGTYAGTYSVSVVYQ